LPPEPREKCRRPGRDEGSTLLLCPRPPGPTARLDRRRRCCPAPPHPNCHNARGVVVDNVVIAAILVHIFATCTCSREEGVHHAVPSVGVVVSHRRVVPPQRFRDDLLVCSFVRGPILIPLFLSLPCQDIRPHARLPPPSPAADSNITDLPSPPPSSRLPPRPLGHLLLLFPFLLLHESIARDSLSFLHLQPSSPSPPPLLPFSPPRVIPPRPVHLFCLGHPHHRAIYSPRQQIPRLEILLLKGNAYPRSSLMRESKGGLVWTCFLGCKWLVMVVV
jgi:hypothetical protein